MNIEQVISAACEQTRQYGCVLPDTKNTLSELFPSGIPATVQQTQHAPVYHIYKHEYPMLTAGALQIVKHSLPNRERNELQRIFSEELYAGDPRWLIAKPQKTMKFVDRIRSRNQQLAESWLPLFARHIKTTEVMRIHANPQRKAS